MDSRLFNCNIDFLSFILFIWQWQCSLKGWFTPKWKPPHYLLSTMPMEGWVKCLSPQRICDISSLMSHSAVGCLPVRDEHVMVCVIYAGFINPTSPFWKQMIKSVNSTPHIMTNIIAVFLLSCCIRYTMHHELLLPPPRRLWSFCTCFLFSRIMQKLFNRLEWDMSQERTH